MITRTTLLTFLVGLALFLGCADLVEAHEDTILRYRFGRISGLPTKYLPAEFDKRKFVLTIADQRYEFPTFLIDLIKSQKKKPRISMHASWYHNGPAYMAIDFMAGKNDGYSCLFLLDDLSKMSLTRDTPLSRGSYRTENVVLSDEQRKALAKGYVHQMAR